MQAVQHMLEENAVLPLHGKSLERCDLVQRVEQVALLLVDDLALDELNGDQAFAGANEVYLVDGRRRTDHRRTRGAPVLAVAPAWLVLAE